MVNGEKIIADLNRVSRHFPVYLVVTGIKIFVALLFDLFSLLSSIKIERATTQSNACNAEEKGATLEPSAQNTEDSKVLVCVYAMYLKNYGC